MNSDTKNLKTLGQGNKTEYVFDKPDSNLLETFANQHPDKDYVIPIECFEFSSLCPKTKQPDFATIHINYVPDELCVESKSLKLYLFSFRNHGEFMEDCTNRIAKTLIEKLEPRYLEVFGKFNSRGGIALTPVVTYWSPALSAKQIDHIKHGLVRTSALLS